MSRPQYFVSVANRLHRRQKNDRRSRRVQTAGIDAETMLPTSKPKMLTDDIGLNPAWANMTLRSGGDPARPQ